MQENVGSTDQWLRIAVGGALVLGATRSLGARGAFASGLILATGALLLQTAVTRVCPVNAALRLDTRGWKPFGSLGRGSDESGSEQESSGQDMEYARAEGGT
jgi:hypothetical protein